jgi:hypothetical protein
MGTDADERKGDVELGSTAKVRLGRAYLVALLGSAIMTTVVRVIPGLIWDRGRSMLDLDGVAGTSTVDVLADAVMRTLLWSLVFWFFLLLSDRQRIRSAAVGRSGVRLPKRPPLHWDDIRELRVLWLRRRWGIPRPAPAADATHARVHVMSSDPLWLPRTRPKGGSALDQLANYSIEANAPVMTLPDTSAELAREIVELARRSGVPVRDQREVARSESFRVDRRSLLIGLAPLAVVLLVALLLASR